MLQHHYAPAFGCTKLSHLHVYQNISISQYTKQILVERFENNKRKSKWTLPLSYNLKFELAPKFYFFDKSI